MGVPLSTLTSPTEHTISGSLNIAGKKYRRRNYTHLSEIICTVCQPLFLFIFKSVEKLTCRASPDGVLGISLRTTVLPAPPGCKAVSATTWPLPLPPSNTGWVFCTGRTPCVALATGLRLAAGEAAGRALFIVVLPGATGSSRRLLLRWGRICICLETGVFCRKGKI